jgi:arginine kinase
MTSEGLTNYELSEDDAAMIVSTRIRVGRNLADYPLGPGVSKEQRLEIMEKVTTAAQNFDADLKGTFYPLEGMSKADQDQLIADHFLFK